MESVKDVPCYTSTIHDFRTNTLHVLGGSDTAMVVGTVVAAEDRKEAAVSDGSLDQEQKKGSEEHSKGIIISNNFLHITHSRRRVNG